MVQLKLTLKSNRPSVVYSTNGKSYKLQPGQNTLNLEYDDYVSLATALSIRPIEKPEDKPAEEPVNDAPKQEVLDEPAQEEVDENTDNSADKYVADEEPVNESLEQPVEDAKQEHDELLNEEVDYSTWSYTDLKAKYKEVTGKSCKLKKDELVAFLQEHSNDA